MIVTDPQDDNGHEGLTWAPDSVPGLRSLGWPVRWLDDRIILSATSGFCAVAVSVTTGVRMLNLLTRMDAEGPVIGVSRPEPSYIFLAEADIVLESSAFEDVGAFLVRPPQIVVLPSPGMRDSRSWVVPPHPTQRYRLPSASTVLWAVDYVRRR